MVQSFSLLLPVLFPMLCGLLLAVLPFLKKDNIRKPFVLFALLASLALTVWKAFGPEESLFLCSLAPGADISFAADGIARLFTVLIAFM